MLKSLIFCYTTLHVSKPEVQIITTEIDIYTASITFISKKHSKSIWDTEMIVSETNRAQQFLLWSHWQNLQQLSNFAFNDHSKSSRKWSKAALVFSNEIAPISFSVKGMGNENKIIPQSVSLLDKLIFFLPAFNLVICIAIRTVSFSCVNNHNNF